MKVSHIGDTLGATLKDTFEDTDSTLEYKDSVVRSVFSGVEDEDAVHSTSHSTHCHIR